MTVKELITSLLDMDMKKDVTIEYPTARGKIVGNYSRFEETEDFKVTEYMHGVLIGVCNED